MSFIKSLLSEKIIYWIISIVVIGGGYFYAYDRGENNEIDKINNSYNVRNRDIDLRLAAYQSKMYASYKDNLNEINKDIDRVYGDHTNDNIT